MARNICNAAICMMAGMVVQASQCSIGSECPSNEQSHKFASLLQTKRHTSVVVAPSKTNEDAMISSSKTHEEVMRSPSKTNQEVMISSSQTHEEVMSFPSKTNQEVMSAILTNAGTFTLQGRWLPTGGVPMSCAIPICDRSCSHGVGCCATQMFEALSEITSWMDSNTVEYVVLFGTLLGAHRDKDIIQWTGDLDIGIYSKDVAKLTAQKDIPWSFGYQKSFGMPRGCENNHKGFPGNYSKFQMGNDGWCDGGDPNCSYYIDLYVLDEDSHGGNIAEKCIASSKGLDGHITKTSVEIRGQQFYAPSKVEDCLEAQYGADWKVPASDESFHGR